MIKLIATDMDGTFLSDDKKLPEGCDALLAKLKEMGIRFVVESGSIYPSLERQFPNHLADIIMVAENGAIVVDNKKEVISFPMKKELVINALESMEGISGVEPVVCGKYCAYTRVKEIQDVFVGPKMQYEMELVDNLYDYVDDAIKTAAILYNGKTLSEAYKELRPLLHEDIYAAGSGEDSIDIGTVGVNKGAAVRTLQEQWGITPEETLVFGDQFNDVEMLGQGYYSYAMAHAVEDVKKHARFIGGSNNDGFVLQEICRLLEIEI